MSKKASIHLEDLKEALHQTDKITNEEKSLAVRKIEEWYTEDKGMELLGQQLMKITKEIGPILEEMGLL